jgi:hypothetical protein
MATPCLSNECTADLDDALAVVAENAKRLIPTSKIMQI